MKSNRYLQIVVWGLTGMFLILLLTPAGGRAAAVTEWEDADHLSRR